MQIHELPALGRTPITGDSLAIDTGSATVKIDYAALATAILDNLGAGSDGVVDIAHGGTGESTAVEARAALGAAASAEIADAYNDNGTYDVGELCIYNNTLYKCTTAIDTAEAWNADHWTATTISEVMVKQSDVVDNLTSTATDKPGSANMLRELNEKLSLQKATVTLASGVTAALNVVAKQLNVVYLDLLCKKSQWAEGDLIATLPVEYRPTNIVHTFAVNYNMPSDNVQISIGTDGQIKIWNKGTQAQGNLYINILWFVGL